MARIPTDPAAEAPEPTPSAPGKGSPNSKAHLDEALDEALDETFPASDPVPWMHRDD